MKPKTFGLELKISHRDPSNSRSQRSPKLDPNAFRFPCTRSLMGIEVNKEMKNRSFEASKLGLKPV